MAAAIVDNNVPFAAADTFSPLFKDMFPDSEIAKSFASARTKTKCIVNGALRATPCKYRPKCGKAQKIKIALLLHTDRLK